MSGTLHDPQGDDKWWNVKQMKKMGAGRRTWTSTMLSTIDLL
jgi:hypothetical protein